jgi:hypothetical protein
MAGGGGYRRVAYHEMISFSRMTISLTYIQNSHELCNALNDGQSFKRLVIMQWLLENIR